MRYAVRRVPFLCRSGVHHHDFHLPVSSFLAISLHKSSMSISLVVGHGPVSWPFFYIFPLLLARVNELARKPIKISNPFNASISNDTWYNSPLASPVGASVITFYFPGDHATT